MIDSKPENGQSPLPLPSVYNKFYLFKDSNVLVNSDVQQLVT